MSNPAGDKDVVPADGVGNTLYKKDFWREENLKYSPAALPHGKSGTAHQ